MGETAMLYNIKHPDEKVSFKEAVIRGIGSDNGLFFPQKLPFFENIAELLDKDMMSRSTFIAQQLLQGTLSAQVVKKVVEKTLDFPIVLKEVDSNVFALELFWGPTLAFKDVGARFLANVLHEINPEPITIITATSGDTGAAVAHAFYDIPHVNVVILYPHQKISNLQERLFCTLGKNIHTFSVQGDFDDCQALVKQCFSDKSLNMAINSANSINITRVFAQCLYYFEALAQLKKHEKVVVCVPSGNFGNLTAAMFARSMGLPIDRFIAATNANDTVPRYLATGQWQAYPTRATLSNAMDVSQPNNWPRIEELVKQQGWDINTVLQAVAFDDKKTQEAMVALQKKNYIAEPHSAIAYRGLTSQLRQGETGVFLCTAHPAKFKDQVDTILGVDLPLPSAIASTLDKPLLSTIMPNDYNVLANFLKNLA